MSLAFFYRHKTGSGQIRGEQIAQALGAKTNPTSGCEGDIGVAVKLRPHHLPACRRVFIDPVDDWRLVPWLKAHPEFPVMVTAVCGMRYLGQILKNPLVLIPQQHCNNTREIKWPRGAPATVGYIGEARSIEPWLDAFEDGFRQMGLTFLTMTTARTRHEVVEFYRSIDIQLAWRLECPPEIIHLKSPLKLANAGSFRIPTVARVEPAVTQEWDGAYLPATTVQEALDQVARLASCPTIYDQVAQQAFLRAEPYHLDHVAARYRGLLTYA